MTQGLLLAALGAEIIALIVTILALYESAEDVYIVNRRNIGNGRRLYAYGALRREVLRFLIVAVFIGVTWMIFVRLDAQATPSGWAIIMLALFLFGQGLTAANSLLDIRLWRRLRRHHPPSEADHVRPNP